MYVYLYKTNRTQPNKTIKVYVDKIYNVSAQTQLACFANAIHMYCYSAIANAGWRHNEQQHLCC